jgi:hypothetical protein
MAILDRNLAVFVPAAPVAASMLLVVDCIVDSPNCVFALRLPGVLASIPSRSSSSSCTCHECRQIWERPKLAEFIIYVPEILYAAFESTQFSSVKPAGV